MNIEKFNPKNSAALTAEDILELQNLTSAEIKELAQAYPNNPAGDNYLLVGNKDIVPDKQVLQEGTFPSLATLRRLKQNRFYAHGFKGSNLQKSLTVTGAIFTQKTVDLTPAQIAELSGLQKPKEEVQKEEAKAEQTSTPAKAEQPTTPVTTTQPATTTTATEKPKEEAKAVTAMTLPELEAELETLTVAGKTTTKRYKDVTTQITTLQSKEQNS